MYFTSRRKYKGFFSLFVQMKSQTLNLPFCSLNPGAIVPASPETPPVKCTMPLPYQLYGQGFGGSVDENILLDLSRLQHYNSQNL